MDNHALWVVLLVLPFPIWPCIAFRLFHRLRTTRQRLFAGLASVALAVGFVVAFWQWLEELQLARVAAVVYGSPACFFLLAAASSWFARHFSGSPSTFGGRTSPEWGEDKGRDKGTA